MHYMYKASKNRTFGEMDADHNTLLGKKGYALLHFKINKQQALVLLSVFGTLGIKKNHSSVFDKDLYAVR